VVSRVTSIDKKYMDPGSKQVTVAGSYMPTVELDKAKVTGHANFAKCACGFMLLLLLQSTFTMPAPDIGIFLQDLWPGHQVDTVFSISQHGARHQVRECDAAPLTLGCAQVWQEIKAGKERQVSTPDFIKGLLPDTDSAFVLSAMFTGTARGQDYSQGPYNYSISEYHSFLVQHYEYSVDSATEYALGFVCGYLGDVIEGVANTVLSTCTYAYTTAARATVFTLGCLVGAAVRLTVGFRAGRGIRIRLVIRLVRW
jgi:hypothetical protein